MLEILKEGDSGFKFIVRSPQGQALLESVSFEDPDQAHKALENLKPRMRQPDSFERQTDHEGRFRFALKDSKGRVLGRSNTYGSEAGMENGIVHTRNSILTGSLKG